MADADDYIAAIAAESRRHYATYVLFNHALAATLGLHPTDLQCLSLLALEPEPRTIGDIAEITGLSSGAATRLVDRLQQAGLVRRVPAPEDRRRIRVELTSSPAVDAAWDAPGRAFTALLARYSPDALAVILDYLHRAGEVGRAETKKLRQIK